MQQDYSSADLLTVYLLPMANDKVTPILEKQLKKGTRIVAHDFEFLRMEARQDPGYRRRRRRPQPSSISLPALISWFLTGAVPPSASHAWCWLHLPGLVSVLRQARGICPRWCSCSLRHLLGGRPVRDRVSIRPRAQSRPGDRLRFLRLLDVAAARWTGPSALAYGFLLDVRRRRCSHSAAACSWSPSVRDAPDRCC